jgi:hypothetical protein
MIIQIRRKNWNNRREELDMQGITDLDEGEVKRKELVEPNREALVCPTERVPCSQYVIVNAVPLLLLLCPCR